MRQLIAPTLPLRDPRIAQAFAQADETCLQTPALYRWIVAIISFLESEAGWRQLMSEVDDFLPAALPAAANLSALTIRESEVLNADATGHGNQAIAKQLGIAEKRSAITFL